jgi:hypothetical protein
MALSIFILKYWVLSVKITSILKRKAEIHIERKANFIMATVMIIEVCKFTAYVALFQINKTLFNWSEFKKDYWQQLFLQILYLTPYIILIVLLA